MTGFILFNCLPFRRRRVREEDETLVKEEGYHDAEVEISDDEGWETLVPNHDTDTSEIEAEVEETPSEASSQEDFPFDNYQQRVLEFYANRQQDIDHLRLVLNETLVDATNAQGGPLRRVHTELTNYLSDEQIYSNISIAPSKPDLTEFRCSILGTEGIPPFHGDALSLFVEMTESYPFRPPKVEMISRINHPNIGPEGDIRLNILQGEWSPCYTIATILMSISSILDSPCTTPELDHSDEP